MQKGKNKELVDQMELLEAENQQVRQKSEAYQVWRCVYKMEGQEGEAGEGNPVV